MYYLAWFFIISFTCLGVIFGDRLNEKGNRCIFWFTYIVVVILLSIRPETTPDYQAYYNILTKVNANLLGTNFLVKEYTLGVEYGFIFLVFVFKTIFGTNFRLFLVITISVSLLLTIIYMEKILCLMSGYSPKERWLNRYLLLGLFYSYIGLQYQGIALRAALSFCCFIIALYYWLDKKYIRSIVILCVGFTLHRLTIIGAGIIIIYALLPYFSRKLFRGIVYCFALGAFLIYITGNVETIINLATKFEYYIFRYVNYAHYLDDLPESGILGWAAIFLIFLILIIGILYKKGIILERFVMLLVGEVILIVATSNLNGAARIYDYFTLLLYPTMVQCICQRNRQRIYLYFASIVIFVNAIISFRIWGVI